MILLQDVSKIFHKNTQKIVALDRINLEVSKGELVILKGRSGSGKSTLLSLIAALSKPTSGVVNVGGEQVAKLSDEFASAFRRLHVGFIFQRYNLFEQLTVYENITIPLIPLNLSRDEIDHKANTVMKSLDISNKSETAVRFLSGGEQQRVAIARALINNPSIVLADEPTANLDEALSLEFIKIMQQLKEKGKTIIIATHDPLFFDLDMADCIYTMKNGQLCS